jgi:hypothetical protein
VMGIRGINLGPEETGPEPDFPRRAARAEKSRTSASGIQWAIAIAVVAVLVVVAVASVPFLW